MPEITELIAMLKSPKASKRYDACEELRVMPSIPEEAKVALQPLLNDPDKSIVDRAARALEAHMSPPRPPTTPPTTPPWQPIYPLALLGVLTTAVVSSLLAEIWWMWMGVGWDWAGFARIWVYPLLLAELAPWFLVFGIVYLIPIGIAFRMRVDLDRSVARLLVVLAGCGAGFVYFLGFLLAIMMFAT